jgi:hypothetical protein
MAKKRMVVAAGPRARHDVQMRVPIGRAKKVKLTDEATKQPVPCQVVRGELCWMVDHIPPGGEKAYVVETGKGTRLKVFGVEAHRKRAAVEFAVTGRPFVVYRYGKEWARPFFYPVLGPDQVPMTRSYPVEEGVPGETTDHPHHKSLWVAHGDVSGVDNWSEGRGHGKVVHKRVKDLEDGPVVALLREDLDWATSRGRKICGEEREIRIYRTPPDQRIIDLTVTFKATNSKVTFGDTKEGGICSVRVATSMDGSRGGTIENSYGGIGEAETWGRRAVWCDYSGVVRDKLVGLAIFDTPGNLRYPTYWHVRDYGLMTANPFGISHFAPDSGDSGDHVLPKGKTLRFAYRIFLHGGDAVTARIRDKYHDYINPPTVRFER